MSEMASSRRSSRRHASSASDVSSANQRITTIHPEEKSLDAVLFNFERLKLNLHEDIPGFEDRLDFLNMSDVDIDELFVTKRVRTRGNIIYPPKNHRRTAKQIRNWFHVIGNRDKQTFIERAKDLEIVTSHDNSLTWDDTKWTRFTWDGFSFSKCRIQ